MAGSASPSPGHRSGLALAGGAQHPKMHPRGLTLGSHSHTGNLAEAGTSLRVDTVRAHAWHQRLAGAMALLAAAASSAPHPGAAETLLHPRPGLSGCWRGKSLAGTTGGGGIWSRESKRHPVRLLGAGMHLWSFCPSAPTLCTAPGIALSCAGGHVCSFPHVPAGSSLLHRWGWKLPWRRKASVSNLLGRDPALCPRAGAGEGRRGWAGCGGGPAPGVPSLTLQVASGSQKVHVPVGKKQY